MFDAIGFGVPKPSRYLPRRMSIAIANWYPPIFALPTANHVFLPGHRIMVQIQSSWFPLYDRNPQTFVKNIFWAKPEDFKKATQRIYNTSFIELPLVTKS